jgi:hypothetical protein
MAKRSQSTASQARAKRHRRSSEELIADLQRKIEDVRRRQETLRLKKSPGIRAALAALQTLEKGLAASDANDDAELHRALTSAREPLSAFVEARGIQITKRRRAKGRRAR